MMNNKFRESIEYDFETSMKPMDRPMRQVKPKYPQHTVNSLSLGGSGITFSEEDDSQTPEGKAELEVLRAILNREGYLVRLQRVVRTIGKKFKAEAADILDLLRAASIDVVENIVKWREIKNDHDAAFIWNGVNYLLKMPSDLDFMDDYLAIRKYMGFTLQRNPFNIPAPLDEGVEEFTEQIVNPQHVEHHFGTDGYVIGGLTYAKLRKQYVPRKKKSPYASASSINNPDSNHENKIADDSLLSSGTTSQHQYHVHNSVDKKLASVTAGVTSAGAARVRPVSYILNADMSKLRQCELVILQEERKFGVYAIDPDGKVVPRIQALVRHTAAELKKDDKRSLTEPARTIRFAPHAITSDIGLSEQKWNPSEDLNNNANKSIFGGDGDVNLSFLTRKSKYLEDTDHELKPSKKGEFKGGGQLLPVEKRGTEGRARRPIKTTLTSNIEFKRDRGIRTLGSKLAQITKLKQDIEAEKQRLAAEQEQHRSWFETSTDDASVDGLNNSVRSKLEVQKSTISNQLYNYSHELQQKAAEEAEFVLATRGAGALEQLQQQRELEKPAAPQLNRTNSVDRHIELLQRQQSNNSVQSANGSSQPTPIASPGKSQFSRSDTAEHLEPTGVRSPATLTPTKPTASTGTAITRGTSNFRSKLLNKTRSQSQLLGSQSEATLPGHYSDDLQPQNSLQSQQNGMISGKGLNKDSHVSNTHISDNNTTSTTALDQQLRELEIKEKQASDTFHHLVKENGSINALKLQESGIKHVEQSRDIERKRRLLTEDEGRRRGPAAEEPPNVYDHYAVCVQRTIRRWLAQCYAKWYRSVATDAVRVLQAVMRGWFGRMRVRRIRLHFWAATTVQKNFRGWKTRGTSSTVAKRKNLMKSAVMIQRIWRGVLGKRRVESKRALDRAAKMAYDCVDASNINVENVRELGQRILYAIEEPTTTTFPPDEVLHLIRLCVMVLQTPRGNLGLTYYDFFNIRSYDEFDGEYLTWLQAAKMMNRSERFIRSIRTLAFGPSAKPPRLVQVQGSVNLLFQSLTKNPHWHINTFAQMGMGSKVCTQLFKWISSIIEVADRQKEFLALIASSFPDWLPRLFEIQKSARACEFEIELQRRALELVTAFETTVPKDDEILLNALEREINLMKRASNDAKVKIREDFVEMDKVKNDQTSREVVALNIMETKFTKAGEELSELIEDYQVNSKLAEQNDRAAIEKLIELRLQITSQKLKVAELDSQKKLLEMQVEANKLRRKDPARLPVEVTAKVLIAAEAKAKYIIAMVQTFAMVRRAGVKHASDLPIYQLDIYTDLETKENALKVEARRTFVEAVTERRVYDEALGSQLVESEIKEQKSKDQFVPTEMELQEERQEDEIAAKEEYFKAKQYLPDVILRTFPRRPRPVIIALTRDVPMYAAKRMLDQITNEMPGMFVTIDTDRNMGFDVTTMQQILDLRKNIIMIVDHGLTRVTRESFLRNFENTLKALLPLPYVVMALGSEKNSRSDVGSYCGVSKHNLNVMRDGAVKVALETMSYLTNELQRPELRPKMQTVARNIQAPKPEYLVVLEALFVILAADPEKYPIPDHAVVPHSWNVTRGLITEPLALVEHLSQRRKRGQSSLHMLQCIQQYVVHPLWPAALSTVRSEHHLLHLLATFVEAWYKCEFETHRQGGAPLSGLTKASMRGVHSVVIVHDAADPEDQVFRPTSGGWRTCATLLMKAALTDLKIFKVSKKIQDQLCHISVYREQSKIYFEVYNPETSITSMVTTTIYDVPNLVKPNGRAIENTENVQPPNTAEEMYTNLVKLLKFERPSKHKHVQPRLVIKRNYTFLCNLTRKINGYRVLMKCYEAALGELYFTVYIPDNSLQLSLLVNENHRKLLLGKTHLMDDCEKAHIDEQDARPLLQFIVDRIRIAPSITFYKAKNKIDLSVNYYKLKNLSSVNNYNEFQLKLRVASTTGRILQRKLVKFYGVPHLLEVKLVSATKSLKVSVYEPKHSLALSVVVSEFQRKVLLQSISEDSLVWSARLQKVLKVDWHGVKTLTLNRSLHRAVRTICGRKIIVSVLLFDEDKVELQLFDSLISEKFGCFVTKDQLIKLLHYKTTLQLMREEKRIDANPPSRIQDIVMSMKSVVPSGDHTTNLKTMIPAESFDKSLDSYLLHRPNYHILTTQLQNLLKPLASDNWYAGYRTIGDPVELVFDSAFVSTPPDLLSNAAAAVNVAADDVSTNKMPIVDRRQLDTNIRHEPYFPRQPGVYFDVVRARKQVRIVYMEDELNAMVLERAEQAEQVAAMHQHASHEIAQHLRTIGDVNDRNVVIQHGASLTTTALLDNITSNVIKRIVERNDPGYHQTIIDMNDDINNENNNETTEQMLTIEDGSLSDNDAPEILGKVEKLVYEAGIKTNYRDGKVRFHGHVSVKVFEMVKWMGGDGVGRQYRFVLYEPNVAQYFEGYIRSTKHLREILGVHGRDLLAHEKMREMIVFICKYRLDVVKNDITWDGVPVEEGAPPFRIEFQSEKLFGVDKVTPVNEGGDDDEESNKDKLIDIENARGRKIVRLVRRVSGVLMQLIVFEISAAVVKAAYGTFRYRDLGGDLSTVDENDEKSVQDANTLDGDSMKEDGQTVNDNDIDKIQTSNEVGFAELRKTTKMPRYEPPAFRIVGYESRSKRKTVLQVEPRAIVEVAGGMFSPYLNPEKRKDLARVICDALILTFPSGQPFELLLPWSGVQKDTLSAVSVEDNNGKMSTRASAERVLKRDGKLFRAAIRVGKYDLVVSVFANVSVHTEENRVGYDEQREQQQQQQAAMGAKIAAETDPVTTALALPTIEKVRLVIFNFYSTAVSEATEVALTDDEQGERIGQPIFHYPEGAIRAAAIRRLCKFFSAEVEVDVLDDTKKTLLITLLPPKKDYVTDYLQIRSNSPGDNFRPVGIPGPFFPLDTCGTILHRQGMALVNKTIATAVRNTSTKEFIVTVYTKSIIEQPERGLVIKLYDRSNSTTSVLHLGPSELIRQCTRVDEPDLLANMAIAKEAESVEALDNVEEGFIDFTNKGECIKYTQKLVQLLVTIVLGDLCYYLDPQQRVIPTMLSSKKGLPPN